MVTESQTRINLRPSKRTVYTGTVCAQNDKAVGPLIAHFAKSGIPPRTAAPRQPFLVMRVLHPGLARPVDVFSSCLSAHRRKRPTRCDPDHSLGLWAGGD